MTHTISARLLLTTLALGATMAGAQTQTVRPPGAPPGTQGAPAVIPPSPAVATPSPSHMPAGPSRGTGVQQLPGTTAGSHGLPAALASAGPSASAPWTVRLVPRMPFRVGQCMPVFIELLDASGKDAPRGPDGYRVSMSDFDMSVSSSPNVVVGKYDGASSWSTCVCQGAPGGTLANIIATYPAQSINARARVPGVAFRSSIAVPVSPLPAQGTFNPSGCADLPATTTIATGAPPTTSNGALPVGVSPPAGSGGGIAIPPTTTVAQGAAPPQVAQGNPPAGVPIAVSYFPPTNVSVTGTPAEAHVAWSPPRTASSISITRWNEANPNCCRVTSPTLAGSSDAWTDLVQSTGPWIYRVTASFPDGSQQYADTRYTYPEPQAPAGFRAQQTGPGTVTLSWQPVANATYYVVGGPPTTNAERVDGTSTVRTGVPAGNQSWTISTTYESSAGPRQGSQFLSTSLVVSGGAATNPGPVASGGGGATPPAALSGNYRVIATGFRVIHETTDDALSRDGMYDEVYGAFTMLHYDRASSRLLDHDLRRTKVIGDVHHDRNRLSGGTASSTGGFRQGDIFPTVADPSNLYGADPTDDSFPFMIWHGSLTNARDAIIILPTIWEYDGNADGYDKWFANELAQSSRIWSDMGVQSALTASDIGLVTPQDAMQLSYGPTFTTASVFEMAFVGPGVLTLFGTNSYDRPLGSVYHDGQPVLPRRAIVLTREAIEEALRKKAAAPPGTTLPSGILINLPPNATAALPNGGLPWGTIAVPLFDGAGPDLNGKYVLYITVERTP